MTDDEMRTWTEAVKQDLEAFLKGNNDYLPDPFYDSYCIDAWAASKGWHIDRTLRTEDEDYDCITVCAWREGYTARVTFDPVLSIAKQEAAWRARQAKKEAA